ncbi:LysR family transcriptional regulator [Actinomadura rudentiformis]|uniref:LysR family transcriptional regulator n=1 Tax=Actinomadura rudentiformis TaxID=359158 RepID=A0A6H9Y8J2_9ACTN|nr:LysR family transcriptional regulator [Actinomadura rudentiformis]KAB2340418.1 LysR family transcriptional regulator [Actinomadura rudentiformis]
MVDGIELREIRAFLAVAEELHFGRAAEKVGLTPSRVSQTIRALESRLGGLLFERTSRRVTLTPLGTQLREALDPAHEALMAALRTAQDTTRGVAGTFHVGMFEPKAYAGPHLTAIIRTFEARHPACRVVVRELPIESQLEWLRSGQGDALVLRLPNSAPDLTIGPVMTDEARILAVAADHPFARRTDVTAEDLADVTVTDMPQFPRELMDAFIPPRTPAGRLIPRRDVHALSELLPLVALGHVVHVTVTSFAEHYRYPGLTFVPIAGIPRSQTALAWITRKANARIDAFAQAVRDVLNEAAPGIAQNDPDWDRHLGALPHQPEEHADPDQREAQEQQ